MSMNDSLMYVISENASYVKFQNNRYYVRFYVLITEFLSCYYMFYLKHKSDK